MRTPRAAARLRSPRRANRLTIPRTKLLQAIASGVLLAAAFPRMGQMYLAWIAFVPLMLAIRGLPVRPAAGLGWISGFVFYLLSLWWIPDTVSNFTSIPPIAAKGLLVLLAGVAAYSHVFFAAGLEYLASGGVPRLLAAPVVWAVVEWMRTWFVAEFPWNLVGYSQVRLNWILQAADLGGVYLLSAAIVLANAAVTEALLAWRRRAPGAAAASLVLAAACPGLLLAYGLWRLDALAGIPYSGQLRVGIVQGNIPQALKWDTALQDEILAKYLGLTREAADAGAELVVWPEAALPFYLQHDARSVELAKIARERGIDLVVGAPGLDNRGDGVKPYNQAWLVRADGDLAGPYDKIQLVPFGEYIPLGGLFGLVDVAVESIGQFGRGRAHTIFETMALAPVSGDPADARPARFAALICYEGIFPSLTRTFAAGGPDFLVNISNDAWYGDTAAPVQHLVMASMRSIENRLPMVRATNTGISAFVTDEGRIGNTTPLFEEDVVVETVLVRDVWSFYREYGDVFLHTCGALVVMLGLFAAVQRRAAARAATSS